MKIKMNIWNSKTINRTRSLKISLFQIIITNSLYSKVCLYLYSPWNLIVPIKENLLFLLSSKKFRWTMNYIRSNYIIISTGVYNNTRCCFFFFFFISILEKELWIFRDNVREIVRLQGKRFFCPLWGVTRRTERKNSSLPSL